MDLQLIGKRALVTGATRGIGRAIADGLLAEGCSVSICARDAAAVAAWVTAHPVTAYGEALDVADPDALSRWVDRAAAVLGGIDILVCNASALAVGATPEAFKQAFETDLMHTVTAASQALPFLEKSDAGSIVAISSVSGSEDYGYGDAAYGTMKASLLFYIKSLSRHLAPKGIRANVVSPGATWFEAGFWHKVELEDPEGFADAMSRNPMGRMATPEDIANAVIFLSSAAASFVTGANLVVDGGLTQRVQN
jgi:3-oxoacyl-[acyl-carrier protein] reductase